jgi:hypothetical protein
VRNSKRAFFLLPSSFVTRARHQTFSSGRKKEEGRRSNENAAFIAF